MVEVEKSAEPLVAFDRRVPIGRSHRLLGGRQEPVADALVVALTVVVLDVLRQLRSDRRSDFVVRSLVPTDPVPTAVPLPALEPTAF